MPEDRARLHFDAAWMQETRARCIHLLELSIFGDLRTTNPAALPRLHKRLLDLCERWRSLFNDRNWIAQPREQLKSAMGAALAVRDSLANVAETARALTGGADYALFAQELAAMATAVSGPIEERISFWSTTLERINRENLSESGD